MSQEPHTDARSYTSVANGALGGRPGTVYDAAALADSVTDAILAGKRSPVTVAATAQPISEDDKRTLRRMTGLPAEAFLDLIQSKLQKVATLAADRIADKLENEDCKLSDLNMSLAIAFDKNQAASGRTSQIGSVNIQINAGPSSSQPRESVLSHLSSLRSGKSQELDSIPV